MVSVCLYDQIAEVWFPKLQTLLHAQSQALLQRLVFILHPTSVDPRRRLQNQDLLLLMPGNR